MILLELFISFMKIGFTSFGGMSMVPLILEEMSSRGWMTAEDLTNLIAIAEMTPGSLGVNCATFAGTQTAGVLGGIFAVAGVLMPAFTLTLAAGIFYARFRRSSVVTHLLRVVKPICIAMIFEVLITLGRDTFFPGAGADYFAAAICAACFVMLRCLKLGVPAVISAAAVMGIVCYGIL